MLGFRWQLTHLLTQSAIALFVFLTAEVSGVTSLPKQRGLKFSQKEETITPFAVVVALDESNQQTKPSQQPHHWSPIDTIFTLIILLSVLGIGASSIWFNKRLNVKLNRGQYQTLQEIANAVPGAIYQYQIDAQGAEHFPFLSEGIQNLYGLSPKAVMENPQLMWEVISPKTRSQVKSTLEHSMRCLSPWQCEFEVHLPNGQQKWIKGDAIPRKIDEGIIWNGILVDITQQRWQEQLSTIQHRVLEALAKGENLDLVLTQLIRLIEQQTTNLIASILLLTENQLWHWGKSQLPTGYIDAINGIQIGESQGSCGTAAFRGQPVITTNIETDPLWENYQQLAKTYNFKACWSVPIFSSQKTVLGTFALYSSVPRDPYPWEKELIDIATQLAGLAIERKQQEEALQKQAQQEQLLSRITGQIRRSLNLQTVLDRTVQEVRRCLKTDRVLLYGLWEDSAKVIAESVATGWTALLGKNLHDPCLHTVTASRMRFPGHIQKIDNVDQQLEQASATEQVVTSNQQVDPRLEQASSVQEGVISNFQPCYMQMLRDHEVKANLVIPIFQQEQIWGFLIAQACAQPRQWQQEEIDLLQKLSKEVAIAIEQAELYQQRQTELLQRDKLATQLRYQAMHDGLTQLPNRHLLTDRLNYLFQIYHQDERRQEQSPFALLFLDLNNFKAINDTLGHHAGDQVLIAVAKRLQSCLREQDTVSRLGGDEFVVILEGIHTQQDTVEVANRIHEAFAPPTEVDGEQIRLSTSIGIVMDEPRYDDATQMLRDADAAMYEAKENQLPYVVFNG